MSSPIRIERTSVHSQVADRLRSMILAGTFRPGQALPSEREMSTRFGVSPNTLRQGIAYLEATGLVETRHGAGVFVSAGSSDATVARMADVLLDPHRSLLDVIEARTVFEPAATGLAARRRTAEDVADIGQFAAISRGCDPTVTPGNFHPRVIRATHNPVLYGVQRALITGPMNVNLLLEFEPDCAPAWDDAHRQIHAAIRDQAAEAAEDLSRQHIEHVLAVTRRYTDAQAT